MLYYIDLIDQIRIKLEFDIFLLVSDVTNKQQKFFFSIIIEWKRIFAKRIRNKEIREKKGGGTHKDAFWILKMVGANIFTRWERERNEVEMVGGIFVARTDFLATILILKLYFF